MINKYHSHDDLIQYKPEYEDQGENEEDVNEGEEVDFDQDD